MRKQQGQALPLGIALLMAGVLFGIVLFNTGQLASEKSRLSNTADAAVYSGLIWQARALNFQAYTNRAMVANQVSIGQMVSLASWMKYASISIRNLDYMADIVCVVSAGTLCSLKVYTQYAKRLVNQVDNVVMRVAEGIVPVVDMVNKVLSTAQQAVYLSSFAATPELVSEVVKANDTRYNVKSAYALMGLGENAVAWSQFAKRYEDTKGMQRKADLINRSKDEFTNSRDLDLSDILPGAPDRLEIPYVIRLRVKKEGKTNLVSKGRRWEWKGKDTLSAHVETFGCKRGKCGWHHIEVPLGWGSRYVNGDFECRQGFGGITLCRPYMNDNTLAERWADAENEELNAHYGGVRAYYGLKDLTKKNKDPRLALRVEVQLPANQVATSTKIKGLGSKSAPTSLRNGIGKGMFWAGDKMAGNAMASISSGEVFFHPPDDFRPDKRRGKIEVGNLFSPYWEVRLTKTPIKRRLMAWGLRDPHLLTDGVKGIADGASLFVSGKKRELQRLQQYAQQLRDEVGNVADPAERARLEQELASVQSQIEQYKSQSYEQQAQALGDELVQGLQQGQGLSGAAQGQMARYEQQLEQYGRQQAAVYGVDFVRELEQGLQKGRGLGTAAQAQQQVAGLGANFAGDMTQGLSTGKGLSKADMERYAQQQAAGYGQAFANDLKKGHGFSDDAQVQLVTDYTQQLQEYGQQRVTEFGKDFAGEFADSFVEQFESEIVDQITKKINDEAADAIKEVASSAGGI